jgi:hypothetical protein
MPFTLSHPAAAIPLRRFCPRYFIFSALVIGCMMPDAGYYVPRLPAYYAHSFWGSLTVSVPSGVVFWLLFIALREPFCFLLPMPHRAPLLELAQRPVEWSAGFAGRVLLSILLGVWSHIAWDSFTHIDGWIVMQAPYLKRLLFRYGSIHMEYYSLLQQVSTIFGAFVLWRAYRTWMRSFAGTLSYSKKNDEWRLWLWAAIFVISTGIAVLQGIRWSGKFRGDFAIRAFFWYGAVYLICVQSVLITLSMALAPILVREKTGAELEKVSRE